MKKFYHGHMGKDIKPFSEWHPDVREAVTKAIELTEGKHGFKTHSEIWRNCELIISIGHNIYTTSIIIRPPEMDKIKRQANWHNGYAIYSNGTFWANISQTEVDLI